MKKLMLVLLFAVTTALSVAGCDLFAPPPEVAALPSSGPTQLPDTLLCFAANGDAIIEVKVSTWSVYEGGISFRDLSAPDRPRAVTGFPCYVGPYTPPPPSVTTSDSENLKPQKATKGKK